MALSRVLARASPTGNSDILARVYYSTSTGFFVEKLVGDVETQTEGSAFHGIDVNVQLIPAQY